ncbi:unnamed protein product [Calypogeia fissa]
MVSSAVHILGHAASHAARLKEEAYAVRHSRDLFYSFAVEVFGAPHPALDQFLRSLAALCVERRLYLPVSVVTTFLRQRVSVALQMAQAFMIQRRAEAVGFRASRHVTLFDPPLTFTADLYQALQFRVEYGFCVAPLCFSRVTLCPVVFSGGLGLSSPFIGSPLFLGSPPRFLGFCCPGVRVI